MPNYTTNYNLKKPLQTEYYDVDVLNQNADVIDAALKGTSSRLTTVENDVEDILGSISGMLPATLDLENASLSIGDLLIQWGVIETDGTAAATAVFNKTFEEIYNVQFSVEGMTRLSTETNGTTIYTKNIYLIQANTASLSFDITSATLATSGNFKIHWFAVGKKSAAEVI